MTSRAWRRAAAEHRAALESFSTVLAAVPADRWPVPRAAAKWSPAEETLHVALAYEFGVAAVGPERRAMRLRVPAAGAWLARQTLLPAMLLLGTFPRGAAAPAEVRPDLSEALLVPRPALAERLRRAADAAGTAFAAAATANPSLRVVHAYFGSLTPLLAWHVLAAHTRHHARLLAADLGLAAPR